MAPEGRRHTLEACARPECLDAVHALLAELWEDAPDTPHGERLPFETAVAEIAANIVQHAGGGETVAMNLELIAYTDRLEARFCDTGADAGVDVGAASLPYPLAEHGRGLAIARAAVDEVAYERQGALNRWVLVKRLAQ